MSFTNWIFEPILTRIDSLQKSLLKYLDTKFGVMQMNYDEAAAKAEQVLATLNKAKGEIINNVTILKDEIAKLQDQIGQQVPERLTAALAGLDSMATALDAINEDAVVTPPDETNTATDATGTDTLSFPEVNGDTDR